MIYGTLQRKPQSQSVNYLDAFHQGGGLSSVFPSKARGFWSTHSVFLGQQHNAHIPTDRQNDEPVTHPDTGCVITFWGRIDNRKELLTALKPQLPAQSDAELVLLAWLHWHRDVAQHLVGDFTFVIYDPKHQSLFCARDHLGVRPFYYQCLDQHFVFASSLLVLQHSGCCDLSLEEQWLAESLMGVSMSFDKTPYKYILKLPPGHTLYIDAKTHLLQSYYQMSPESDLILQDSREYVEAYQEVLTESIRCRLDQADAQASFGAELSGGIDSSTVTAYAAKMLPQPALQLHCFGYAQCEQEADYINAVSQVTPMVATHIMSRSPNSATSAITDPLNVLGYPEEHANGSGHNSIYQLCNKLNIRTLLSGFGGDEFVTTNSWHTLTELYNVKEYTKLLDYCYGEVIGMRALRFMRFTLRQWRGAQTNRINPRFLKGCQMRWNARILKDRTLQDYSLEQKIFNSARFDAGYSSVNEFTIDARWKPFVPTRMENCILMAAANDIEYRWPLLDVRLINLFLSIPSTEKYYRGKTRWLHRRAIDKWVPKKVTWKMGKDMGNPVLSTAPAMAVNEKLLKIHELHPMLEQIVSEKRLLKLQEVNANSNDRADFSQIFKTAGVRKLNMLNKWLKSTPTEKNDVIGK